MTGDGFEWRIESESRVGVVQRMRRLAAVDCHCVVRTEGGSGWPKESGNYGRVVVGWAKERGPKNRKKHTIIHVQVAQRIKQYD